MPRPACYTESITGSREGSRLGFYLFLEGLVHGFGEFWGFLL